MKQETIITIDGFEIKTNSIYQVLAKPDPNAPSGLKEEGTTKIPSVGVQETIGCRFDRETNKWDHGFNSSCPCYKGRDKREVEKDIENLHKYIVDEYTRQNLSENDDPISSNVADKHWNNFSVRLEEGKLFKTEDVNQAMQLYIALRSYSLTPVNRKGSPKYNNSSYLVEDKNLAVEHKKSKNNLKIDAVGEFSVLLKTDKNKLLHILYYMGNNFDSDTSDIDLKNVFSNIIENNENVEYFMDLVNKSESKKGEEKLFVYKILKTLFTRGKHVTKVSTGFMYDDTEIGPDLKTAAGKIVSDKDLGKIKKEILLGSDD